MITAYVEFLNYITENQPGQWSGYSFWGPDYRGGHYMIPNLLFFGEEADAQPAIKIFTDMIAANNQIASVDTWSANWDSWYGAHGNETDAVGANGFLVSRLIQAENIATPEARAQLIDAFVEVGAATPLNLIGGKGVMDKDPNSTETSVTPAWRKTIGHLTWGAAVPERPDKINEKKWSEAALAASELATPIRNITPNSGTYINESDYFEPNWEEAFFGAANYSRLKGIKQKYDPEGMFRVWNGVGGTRPESSATATE
jgi:FAD/FMN-containing dehydrogenase